MRSLHALIAAAAAAAALAAPAAASAAQLTGLKPCYVSFPATGAEEAQVEYVDLRGTGFTPGATVDLTVDGTPAATAVADATGAIGMDPAAPLLGRSPVVERGDRPFQVVATERGAAGPAAVASPRATLLDVSIRAPAAGRPAPLTSSRVVFRGRGFTDAGHVYAHYRYKARTRKTVRFTPKGPCGVFSARKVQIPIKRPANGRWLVYFDQHKRYRKAPTTNHVTLAIDVTRRPKSASASALQPVARGF